MRRWIPQITTYEKDIESEEFEQEKLSYTKYPRDLKELEIQWVNDFRENLQSDDLEIPTDRPYGIRGHHQLSPWTPPIPPLQLQFDKLRTPRGISQDEYTSWGSVLEREKIIERELDWDESLHTFMIGDEVRYKITAIGDDLGMLDSFTARTRAALTTPISGYVPLSITDITAIGLVAAGGIKGGTELFKKGAERLNTGSFNASANSWERSTGGTIPQATRDAFTKTVNALGNPRQFLGTSIRNLVKSEEGSALTLTSQGERLLSKFNYSLIERTMPQLTKLTKTNTGVPEQSLTSQQIIQAIQGVLPETARAIQSGEAKLTPEWKDPNWKAPEAETPQPIDLGYGEFIDKPFGKFTPTEFKNTDVKTLINKLKTFQKQRDLPLEYKDKIKSITEAYDLNFRIQRTIDRRTELRAYVERMKQEGEEITVPNEYIEMASKVNVGDLTLRELESIYSEASSAVQQGKLKNRLIKIQNRRKVEEVVNDVVGQIGEGIKITGVITAETFRKNFLEKSLEKTKGFMARTYRQERVFDELDNYTEGVFTNTIWKPVNNAKTQFLKSRIEWNDRLKNVIKENDINFTKMIAAKQRFGDVVLTGEEKIGVYLSSLNNDNLLHLQRGNKFSDKLIKEVVNSMTDEETILADFLQGFFNDTVRLQELSKVRTQVEGKPITPVDEYFPIRLEWQANPELHTSNMFTKEDIYRYVSKWASSGIKKGFLKERSGKAMQPVNLKAFEIFDYTVSMTEHYKAFAPVIRDLQLIVNNPRFKTAYKSKVGDAGYAVLDRWLKQVAEVDPLRVTNAGEKIGRVLRTNAVTAVLGLNIITALKQFPSFFSGMAEAGTVPIMRGLTTFISNPKETLALIKEKSPQIHARTMERELAEVKASRNIGKRITGKLGVRDVFMIFTTTMDRLAVSSIWRGSYDDYLRRNPDKDTEAAEYAERIVRRTQPFFDVKDVPEYWRSGELAKALTMFTNQLNNYWNYYRFDIFGKRAAGEINDLEVLRRLLYAFIIPGLMIGAITRSQLPEDAKEAGGDLLGMALAVLPIVGSWASAGYRGYKSSGIVTTEALEAIRDIAYWANKGELKSTLMEVPELAAIIMGVPYSQPKRSVEAMLELAEGKSDDWLKLIWGSYVRDEAARESSKGESGGYVPPRSGDTTKKKSTGSGGYVPPRR